MKDCKHEETVFITVMASVGTHKWCRDCGGYRNEWDEKSEWKKPAIVSELEKAREELQDAKKAVIKNCLKNCDAWDSKSCFTCDLGFAQIRGGE